MPVTKNFRHGHRERVRARFLREGLTPFADYEVLELLLFYAIPRRDTKEQAHALDDTFGSLYGVLSADEAALCRVPGIGARTAHFLSSLYPFLEYVAKREPYKDVCKSERELADRIFPYVVREGEDSALLVFLNNRDEVITTMPLGCGRSMQLIRLADVLTAAYAYRTSAVLFADYKAEGIPFPDAPILDGVHSLHEDLAHAGVHMRDYMLFTDSQFNSLFSLTGERRMYAASPFFLAVDPARKLYSDDSLRHLSDILSYVVPEASAVALAKDLLEKYGSLSTLLSLPYETLCVGRESNTAELLFLKILSELYSAVGFSRARAERAVYRNADDVGRLFCDVIGFNDEETVAIALFDRDMRLIDALPCARGSVNTASFAMRTLIEAAVSRRAAFVAVAHNHPGGSPVPSGVDFAMTSELCRAFRSVKIAFIDHFVVTSDRWTSIAKHPAAVTSESWHGLPQQAALSTDMPDEFFRS